MTRRNAKTLLLPVMVLTACSSEPDPVDRPTVVSEIATPAGTGAEVPHLAVSATGVLMSWIEPVADGTASQVVVAEWADGDWTEPAVVAESDQFFVNWADFPSVVESGEGAWVAHWLARGSEGGYDYGVQMSGAANGEWGYPWTLHEDQSPSEHGFVTVTPLEGGGLGAVWLDGRDFPGNESPEMQLRYREIGPEGPRTDEVLLDGRTCECCQTDAAIATDGLVIVYRNRTDGEIRDIGIVRQQADGTWSEPGIVHADDWEMHACPVNGPAVDARGERVAVAWFTGAQDDPRVQVAFSSDGGATFGPPTRVDEGAPVGRVDVVLRDEGAAVSWVEETGPESAAEVLVRAVSFEGASGTPVSLAATSAARRSGFPQMVPLRDGLMFAWHDTEAETIKAALLDPDALDGHD